MGRVAEYTQAESKRHASCEKTPSLYQFKPKEGTEAQNGTDSPCQSSSDTEQRVIYHVLLLLYYSIEEIRTGRGRWGEVSSV